MRNRSDKKMKNEKEIDALIDLEGVVLVPGTPIPLRIRFQSYQGFQRYLGDILEFVALGFLSQLGGCGLGFRGLGRFRD